MSQVNPGPMPGAPAGPQIRPGPDLYSVLLIVATVLLATGTVLVAVRTQQLFGTLFPPAGG